jgi:GWxTD domain-containing protein
LGLLKEEDVMRYRYMIDPEEGGIIYFYEFAKEDKEKAVFYYNKVISIKPDFPDVYYHLGMLYYEYNELFDMIDLLERAVKIIPKDKNCHLFLGFAYYQDEQYERAEEQFKESMKYMTPEERQIFNSIESIITPEERMKLTTDLANYNRNVAELWRSRDPLILTNINERKLEHYSRVAYANLRFSDFDKGIEGWNTDQGKVYIRFGKPETMYRTRPEIGTSGDGNPRNPLNHSKEFWLYPDFEYIFEDRFLQNRYEFAWGNTPENDYRNVFDRMISVQPDYYDFIQKNNIIEIATDITEFKGSKNSTKVNLSYAIPSDSIHYVYQNNKWKSRLNQGIFLLNGNWKKIYESSKLIQFDESEQFKLCDESYLLHQEEFENRPGQYQLIFEIHDLESRKHTSIRSEIDIKHFDNHELALSNIQMAFKIEQDSIGGYYYTRDDLKILPNPLKRFTTGDPVFIYYEIYNLKKNESGLTSYNVEYTISPDKANINPIKKILQRLNLFKLTGEITTSYQIEGDSETEYHYRQIGLGSFSPGDYLLTLRITDLNANKTTTEKVQFKLEDE